MKIFLHTDGRVIREDELVELTMPKVGDRLMFKGDNFFRIGQKAGEIVEIVGTRPITIEDENGSIGYISLEEFAGAFEPLPSPPVCPDELMPLPDGTVYLGNGNGTYQTPAPVWKWGQDRWNVCVCGSWAGNGEKEHYATIAGDACHRAQPWFDESQVPKVEEKPAPLRLEVGKRYVTRNGRVTKPLVNDQGDSGDYLFAESPGSPMEWTKSGNYWSSGKEDPEDIIREATPEERGEVATPDYAARAKEQLQSLIMPSRAYADGIRSPLISLFVDNLIQAAKQP